MCWRILWDNGLVSIPCSKSGWRCPESLGDGTSTGSPLWPSDSHSEVSIRHPCSCRSCWGNTWTQLVPCHHCCVEGMYGNNNTFVTKTVIFTRLKLNFNTKQIPPTNTESYVGSQGNIYIWDNKPSVGQGKLRRIGTFFGFIGSLLLWFNPPLTLPLPCSYFAFTLPLLCFYSDNTLVLLCSNLVSWFFALSGVLVLLHTLVFLPSSVPAPPLLDWDQLYSWFHGA